MKGIYNKVVSLIVPILDSSESCNKEIQLKNTPETMNKEILENEYNITILQEFRKIPSKILHKKESRVNNDKKVLVFIEKLESKKANDLTISFSIKKNRRNVNYKITKIQFENSVSFNLTGLKRQRDESEINNETIVKRPRSYSDALQITSNKNLQDSDKSTD